MTQDLPFLDPPYNYLDILPGQVTVLDVVRWELGRSVLAPPGRRNVGSDRTLRLHTSGHAGPQDLPYVDVPSPRLIAVLEPLLDQIVASGGLLRLTRLGATDPPAYSVAVDL